MMQNKMLLDEAKREINEALKKLTAIYEDPISDIGDMGAVIDYCKLLDRTDFVKTVCERGCE